MIKTTQAIILTFILIFTNLYGFAVNGKKLMGLYESVVIIPIQKEKPFPREWEFTVNPKDLRSSKYTAVTVRDLSGLMM